MLVLEKTPGVSGREEDGLGGRDASFEEPESAVLSMMVVVLVERR